MQVGGGFRQLHERISAHHKRLMSQPESASSRSVLGFTKLKSSRQPTPRRRLVVRAASAQTLDEPIHLLPQERRLPVLHRIRHLRHG